VSISIDLTAQEIAALKQVTRLENDAEAVAKAAREFLRLSRLRELKAASGNVEFEANWQELEELELGECGFPQ
jgi:Arc/MetJ family transcription regulator